MSVATVNDADLLARIAHLNAAYARCIDSGNLAAWPAFFADSCLYTITSADNYAQGLPAGLMYADTRGMLVDRVSALAEANIYERHTYRHVIGMPFVLDRIAERDGARVTCETPFLVVRIMRDGPSEIFASGCYRDVAIVTDDAALFAERVVVCDSTRIDTLLALPL